MIEAVVFFFPVTRTRLFRMIPGGNKITVTGFSIKNSACVDPLGNYVCVCPKGCAGEF